MSSPDWNLSRRAAACKGWRWMPGMLLDRNERLVGIDEEGCPYGHSHTAGHRVWLGEGSHPNLSDPATLGCLLALVREALKPRGWGVTLCLANTGAGWQLGYLAGGEWFSPLGTIHRSEAKALVAALEVAQ